MNVLVDRQKIDYFYSPQKEAFLDKAKNIYQTTFFLEKMASSFDLYGQKSKLISADLNIKKVSSHLDLFNSCLKLFSFHTPHFDENNEEPLDKALIVTESLTLGIRDLINPIISLRENNLIGCSQFIHEGLQKASLGLGIVGFITSIFNLLEEYQLIDLELEEVKQQLIGTDKETSLVVTWLNLQKLIIDAKRNDTFIQIIEKTVYLASLVLSFTSYVLVSSFVTLAFAALGLYRVWKKSENLDYTDLIQFQNDCYQDQLVSQDAINLMLENENERFKKLSEKVLSENKELKLKIEEFKPELALLKPKILANQDNSTQTEQEIISLLAVFTPIDS
jgi:hypothetical protein